MGFNFVQYPVTYSIIGVNVLIFILINLRILDVGKLGSSYMTSLQEKQFYRIITSAFTQKEFLHLACNMYSLYNIGQILEYALKPQLFGACYAGILLVGGTLSARIHKKSSPFTLCIGASGVLCGLFGIYMVIAYSVWGFSGIRSVLPTMFLLLVMTASKKIDSIGHFTGLAVGIIAGIILVNVYSFGVG
ncbi:MAG: rhomboid family intramembrane serine protease [Butyrivibrio sp.]|nr:rhomboid family intramembrane serine protease [Butyrivibrio sp.]